eukprot:TRINITY_DN27469_c0_g1_i1.p1 TRINITY_DN27469_c0_g1~~TRINITY_DN27469_c0_g1_i1.p1  ORF type:complete len:430 (-),score=95.41 TRINITY_DN27469_c0_g1_i1:70-1359(-)
MTASHTVNRNAQEHLMYIQEKVNPMLEALVTAVLLERPEDPAFFMLKWLCEQTKSIDGAADQGQGQRAASTSEEIESVRAEIMRLKERKGQLLSMLGKSKADAKGDVKSDKSTKADESSDEEEDDDDTAEAFQPPKNYNRGPRQSVSAEAYGQWNVKTDFAAPVYEKSSDQKARIEKCLEPSFLFSSMDKEDMNTVILAFKEKRALKDERIITQGEDGESMFLIEAGSVDCLKKVQDQEKVVKTCGPGDVFGELALLYNCPRAATVVTTSDAILWELDRETFNRIVKDAAAKKRAAYTEFLKKVPLFQNMDTYEMMTIADALKVEVIEKDSSQVIKQGDHGDKFFLITEGECVAKKTLSPGQEAHVVMTHKAGDYFGELSLLKNEPRAASIFTSGPLVKLLSMERKTFKRLLGPVEDILRREAKRYDPQ